MSDEARELAASDVANLPVGGQAEQNGQGDHSARSQSGKGFVHAAFVCWGSEGARLGSRVVASAQQGNRTRHDDEETERRHKWGQALTRYAA